MTAPEPQALKFVAVRNVPLNFQLGEWRMWSVARRLAVFECTDRTRSPRLDALPPIADADGYLIKSLPAPLDAQSTASRPGWFQRTLREYPRHLVDLTTGYEAYLAKFSGKTRSTLKRKLRKFQELSGGEIDWREYRTPEELASFFPLAQELSAKTYQERLLGAGLPDKPAFKEAALALAAQGAVRAYILFLDKKPVAYLYLPVEDGRVIYAYLGYDPMVGEHSPGTVLQLLSMERLFAEPGLTVFDFTEGAGQHKQLFATHTEQCADVLILRRRASTVALAYAHAAFTRAERGLAKALDTIGVKRRMKMMLRALAASRE
jgi:CelD/BcsL family acetyltransferase involved in cellulose biosynthesis